MRRPIPRARVALTLCALGAAMPAAAVNPVLPGYWADPDIRIFGGKYYIYPTTDNSGWNSKEFYAWSSPDLAAWTKSGPILSLDSVPWGGEYNAWAPTMGYKAGRYYFYFVRTWAKIGVAVGDKPDGPFKDALGKELVDGHIDPCFFRDDDGKDYLYYSVDGHCRVRQLADDMVSFATAETEVTPKDNFFEGTFVFKRKGTYYMTYSAGDFQTPDYRVYYAMSKSPLGPFDNPSGDLILQTTGDIQGPGHNSVLNIPGTDDWYMVYHRKGEGSGFHRSVCIDTLRFDAQGHILPVTPTAAGVGPRPLGPVTSVLPRIRAAGPSARPARSADGRADPAPSRAAGPRYRSPMPGPRDPGPDGVHGIGG